MRPLREGAPGREDEIGRVKVQVIIEVEPFHTGSITWRPAKVTTVDFSRAAVMASEAIA
ncbi:Uncharacterised protein [Klebsiella pneumoniae]|uniref:Uncharacterized protein n=1 Tax=Klebsiella pneumoniae TaxID=573 RepID=A0A378A0M4_KLEPN|nr:Uncharacterised protein [Klebsiella pneumoniae]